MRASGLERIEHEVIECRACPRLVDWREHVAAEKVARYADQTYWGRPVPAFGDPGARILILGLAPAAHGANRTGRMFTGDRSGDFLYAALHRVGLANQPTSAARDDGLAPSDVWISAVNRCAPPGNRPTPQERDRCLPYLEREIHELGRLRVIVALGAYAWDGGLRARSSAGLVPRPKPRFGHGAEVAIGSIWLLGCYHPSQQNTFTGTLTAPMLDAVLRRARALAEGTYAPSLADPPPAN